MQYLYTLILSCLLLASYVKDGFDIKEPAQNIFNHKFK